MYPLFGPIMFQIGPFALHWYGFIMVVAIIVAAWVAARYVARHGRDSNTIWDMLLWVLIPALIGERLYYVFIQSPRGPNGLDHYLANPIEILEIWRGGMHIYGAFIFGGIALALYARWRKLPLLIYLDAVGLALPLGQAIGRWANFINQELYGPPTTLPWGLRIDDQHRLAPYNNLTLYPESTRFQPLFLYESLANLLGFMLIFWISRRFEKRLRSGDLFLLYLIWYPTVRFFLEFFRTDSWFFPGTPFNVVHLLSFITVVTAVTLLIVRRRNQPQVSTIANTGANVEVEAQGVDGLSVDEVKVPEGESKQKADDEVENTDSETKQEAGDDVRVNEANIQEIEVRQAEDAEDEMTKPDESADERKAGSTSS
jgi:phosphatidylglycerol:prolipoprotein diacylglycerol transferase